MQKINTFFYGIGQGLKNIRRNRMFSLASIATMAACLFLFGVFYFVLANFKHILLEAETRVGVTVFFEEGTTEEEILAIKESIALRPEAGSIEYISADQAWENYKKEKLTAELAETFGNDNPLENSASLTVYLSEIEQQDTLTAYIRGIRGVRKVNDKKDVSKGLASLNKIVTIIGVVIVVVLLLVAVFLINMTISTGINVRRQEISIMKLIGATDYFVRIPFVVEGVIIGLIGAVIPLIVIRVGYNRIINTIMDRFPSLFTTKSFLSCGSIMKVIVPASLLIGIGIGFIGSMGTLSKQLRQIEDV